MKKVLILSFIAFLASVSTPLFAQNWELGVGLNGVNYLGDLVKDEGVSMNNAHLDYSIFARHNFAGDRLSLRLGLNVGKLSGNDANYSSRQNRNFNFKTPLTELAATFEWAPLSIKKADGSLRSAYPYFLGGLSLAMTNPTVFFNENSPSTAYAKGGISSDKANLKKAALGIPIGAGFKVPTDMGTFGLEIGYRWTVSDFIDGISQAANPNKRDAYVMGGINYAYNFGGASKAKAALKAKEEAEQAIRNKDAKDRVAREQAAKEQELRDKEAAEKEAAEKIIRDKEAAAKAMRDKEAADKVLKENALAALAAKALAEKATTEAAAKAMRDKDTDGDGVADIVDKCPTVAGSKNNEGCPELSKVDKQTITEAISNINFKTSSAEFTGESLAILNKVADVLTRNPQYKVSIEGHTDAQGKEAANLALSNARAAACVKYLVGKGIAAGRMTSAGFGSSRPVAGNDTEINRRKNRRVEFVLSL